MTTDDAKVKSQPGQDRIAALVNFQYTLLTYFDQEELIQLCFELDIDYDGLKAMGHEGKARELVRHCRRRGKLSDLFELAKSKRPSAPWRYAASLFSKGDTHGEF